MESDRDNVKPEPGSDDARSADGDVSREDRQKAKENADRMRKERYGGSDKDENDDGSSDNHRP